MGILAASLALTAFGVAGARDPGAFRRTRFRTAQVPFFPRRAFPLRRRFPRRARWLSSRFSGATPEPSTACRGRCLVRSTRSSRTSARTWGQATRARSVGCSFCPRRGTLGRRRRRRRHRRPLGPGGRDLRGGAISRRHGRSGGHSRAIFSYNHSYEYVDRVMQIASGLGGGGIGSAGPPLATGTPGVVWTAQSSPSIA